ncbi:hypothetical protein BAE44_0015040 [Dichanthelium oligosanthes]|uniref:Uncharacterized protein n=1 Tax=Dichanthelium oligosanthes TaxID=888268 RepID=A0A1E5VFR2_9POAL|nr:hypothetical protein BAE44_0015040 [Dichanthelium oligosanthes]
MVPRKFSLVCFRLRARFAGDDAVDGLNRELLAAVNVSGRAFMTHFVVDGRFVIRLAVSGAMTEMQHVIDAWELTRGSCWKARPATFYSVTDSSGLSTCDN